MHGIRVRKLLLPYSRVYHVQEAGRSWLADSGWRWERPFLHRALNSLALRHCDGLLLTHAHADHAGNAAWLQERYQCPIYAGPESHDALRRGWTQLPKGATLSGRILHVLWALPCFRPLRRIDPCRHLDGPSSFPKNSALRVLPSPGHSLACQSIVLGDRFAFIGDLAVYRQGHVGQRLADLPHARQESLRRMKERGVRLCFPGHGQAFVLSQDR